MSLWGDPDFEKDVAKQVKPFPVNSAKALRMSLLAEAKGRISPFVMQVFREYWKSSNDISQDDVLRAVALKVGLDPDEMLAFAGSTQAKQQLRANTDDLIARGGFGSPTIFVNKKHMYFGNDRLGLVERRVLLESGQAVVQRASWEPGEAVTKATSRI